VSIIGALYGFGFYRAIEVQESELLSRIGSIYNQNKQEVASEPFHIEPGLAFVNMNHSIDYDSSRFWAASISSGGPTIYPIPVVLYADITNLTDKPQQIDDYSIALHTEQCGWTYLFPISIRDVTVYWLFRDPHKAYELDFSRNALDLILQNPIDPGHTASGFLFLDSPLRCSVGLGEKLQYRFTVKTTRGKSFDMVSQPFNVTNLPGVLSNSEYHLTGPDLVSKGKFDLSSYTRRIWGEPIESKPHQP
jgi:hypothetical protein